MLIWQTPARTPESTAGSSPVRYPERPRPKVTTYKGLTKDPTFPRYRRDRESISDWLKTGWSVSVEEITYTSSSELRSMTIGAPDLRGRFRGCTWTQSVYTRPSSPSERSTRRSRFTEPLAPVQAAILKVREALVTLQDDTVRMAYKDRAHRHQLRGQVNRFAHCLEVSAPRTASERVQEPVACTVRYWLTIRNSFRLTTQRIG